MYYYTLIYDLNHTPIKSTVLNLLSTMSNEHGDCQSCASFPKSALGCLGKGLISEVISPNSISISFKKGQDIYTEGAPFKGVFCIQSGKVKIYKRCEDRSLTLGLAGNSDFIGFGSEFNGGTYNNSSRCLEDSQICFIPKKIFLTLISNNVEILLELLKRSNQENHKLSNFLRDLKCTNMLSRVAGALLEITNKFGLDSNKCLNVVLTRKEISEISGTTTESVIRILNQLKKEKIIDFIDNRIKILDNRKLLKNCSSISHL